MDPVASCGSSRILHHVLYMSNIWKRPSVFLVPASTKKGSKRSVAILRYLIKEGGINVNWIILLIDPADAHNPFLDIRERRCPQMLPDRITTLYCTASYGNIDALKYLLKKSVEVRVADGKYISLNPPNRQSSNPLTQVTCWYLYSHTLCRSYSRHFLQLSQVHRSGFRATLPQWFGLPMVAPL